MSEFVEEPPVDEVCVVEDARELSRQAWAEYGPAHAELRGLTERISNALGDVALETSTEIRAFSVEREIDRHRPVFLPCGWHLYLPPTLFGSLKRPGQPIIPETKAGRDELVADYVSLTNGGNTKKLPRANFTYSCNTDDYPSVSLPLILEQMHDNHLQLSSGRWTTYVAAAREQIKNGRYNIESFVNFRMGSTDTLYELPYLTPLLKKLAFMDYEGLLYAHSPGRESYSTPADHWAVPVGQYGQPFAEKLFATLSFLQGGVDDHDGLKQILRGEAAAHEDVLLMHTARSRIQNDAYAGLPHSEKEGILSVIQASTLLTAERIDGYETGEALLAAIIDAGLIEQFARAVPMGFLGPITNFGRYCPGLVEAHGGKLRLNPDMMAEVKVAKNAQIVALAAKFATYKAAVAAGETAEPPEAFGIICPAAMPKGAIMTINKTVATLLGLPSAQTVA